MRKILAPHKEQDGYSYVRVRLFKTRRSQRYGLGGVVPGRGIGDYIAYYHDHDKHRDSRIISSKRVEEAVETMDYFKKCDDEGLEVYRAQLEWGVGKFVNGGLRSAYGTTLREAYHRYHASHDPR